MAGTVYTGFGQYALFKRRQSKPQCSTKEGGAEEEDGSHLEGSIPDEFARGRLRRWSGAIAGFGVIGEEGGAGVWRRSVVDSGE